MPWELLPTNYTNAVWSGLRKYNLIENEDNTVSLQDVTVYSQRDNSFFGALEANRMNEAMNAIMNVIEGDTDLYSAFQNYFSTQQGLFETTVENLQTEFEEFIAEKTSSAETTYTSEISLFKNHQQELFTQWFDLIKGKLSADVAGNLQVQITNLAETVGSGDVGLEYTVSEVSDLCEVLDCIESDILFV